MYVFQNRTPYSQRLMDCLRFYRRICVVQPTQKISVHRITFHDIFTLVECGQDWLERVFGQRINKSLLLRKCILQVFYLHTQTLYMLFIK